MVRNKFSIVVYAIIGLALIGIIAQLFTDPMTFLKSIFMMLGVGVLLFAVVYFIFFKKRTNANTDDMKKYKQAVKQSQLKYKNNNMSQAMSGKQQKKKSNQRASHLRVIDGNGHKSKRKKRATF